jgi:hypothetical protein
MRGEVAQTMCTHLSKGKNDKKKKEKGKKKYPLRREVKEGLILIIKDLKRQALLIECSSLFNTPILGVRKGPNKWRLVQDLHLINEAVVPLHPVVPNPIHFYPRYFRVLLTTLSWT